MKFKPKLFRKKKGSNNATPPKPDSLSQSGDNTQSSESSGVLDGRVPAMNQRTSSGVVKGMFFDRLKDISKDHVGEPVAPAEEIFTFDNDSKAYVENDVDAVVARAGEIQPVGEPGQSYMTTSICTFPEKQGQSQPTNAMSRKKKGDTVDENPTTFPCDFRLCPGTDDASTVIPIDSQKQKTHKGATEKAKVKAVKRQQPPLVAARLREANAKLRPEKVQGESQTIEAQLRQPHISRKVSMLHSNNVVKHVIEKIDQTSQADLSDLSTSHHEESVPPASNKTDSTLKQRTSKLVSDKAFLKLFVPGEAAPCGSSKKTDVLVSDNGTIDSEASSGIVCDKGEKQEKEKALDLSMGPRRKLKHGVDVMAAGCADSTRKFAIMVGTAKNALTALSLKTKMSNQESVSTSSAQIMFEKLNEASMREDDETHGSEHKPKAKSLIADLSLHTRDLVGPEEFLESSQQDDTYLEEAHRRIISGISMQSRDLLGAEESFLTEHSHIETSKASFGSPMSGDRGVSLFADISLHTRDLLGTEHTRDALEPEFPVTDLRKSDETENKTENHEQLDPVPTRHAINPRTFFIKDKTKYTHGTPGDLSLHTNDLLGQETLASMATNNPSSMLVDPIVLGQETDARPKGDWSHIGDHSIFHQQQRQRRHEIAAGLSLNTTDLLGSDVPSASFTGQHMHLIEARTSQRATTVDSQPSKLRVEKRRTLRNPKLPCLGADDCDLSASEKQSFQLDRKTPSRSSKRFGDTSFATKDLLGAETSASILADKQSTLVDYEERSKSVRRFGDVSLATKDMIGGEASTSMVWQSPEANNYEELRRSDHAAAGNSIVQEIPARKAPSTASDDRATSATQELLDREAHRFVMAYQNTFPEGFAACHVTGPPACVGKSALKNSTYGVSDEETKYDYQGESPGIRERSTDGKEVPEPEVSILASLNDAQRAFMGLRPRRTAKNPRAFVSARQDKSAFHDGVKATASSVESLGMDDASTLSTKLSLFPKEKFAVIHGNPDTTKTM